MELLIGRVIGGAIGPTGVDGETLTAPAIILFIGSSPRDAAVVFFNLAALAGVSLSWKGPRGILS